MEILETVKEVATNITDTVGNMIDTVKSYIGSEDTKSKSKKKVNPSLKGLQARVTSSFGISIGTGLALESLFIPTGERYDDNREIPNKVDVNKYDVVAFSILTIARNLLEASNGLYTDFQDALKDKDFESTLLEEMLVIEGLFFGSDCKVIFYLTDYDYISKRINKGKEVFTKVSLKNLAIYRAISKFKLESGLEVYRGDKFYQLRMKHSVKVLMFTAYTTDLLMPYTIDLLESHTGLLLKKEQFGKRYKKLGDKQFTMLPFDEIFLYLLGDTNTSMLCKDGEKVRKEVYNLATTNNWTPDTNLAKILGKLREVKVIRDALSNFDRLY